MNLDQKRDLILVTFRDLCIQQGVDQFSMKKLSKSCGISIGTIYDIFKSRLEIFKVTYKKSHNVIYEGLETNDNFTFEELKVRL